MDDLESKAAALGIKLPPTATAPIQVPMAPDAPPPVAVAPVGRESVADLRLPKAPPALDAQLAANGIAVPGLVMPSAPAQAYQFQLGRPDLSAPPRTDARTAMGEASGSSAPALAKTEPWMATRKEMEDELAKHRGAPPPVLGPPLRAIPAGWDPKRNPARPEHMRGIEEGMVAETEAVQRLAHDQAGAALMQREQYDRELKAAADTEATRQAAEAHRQEQYRVQEEKVAATLDDVARMRIDPNRFYANQDTGSRILMILGGALGGLSAGMQGGPNQFLAHIDRLVERDLDAQKAQLENKRWSVQAQGNLLGQMRARFGDERSAEAAAKAAAYEETKLQLAKLAAGAESVQVQDRARAALAQLQQKQNEYLIRARDIPEYRSAQTVGGASGHSPVSLEKVVSLPGGTQLEFPSAQEAENARKHIGLTGGIIRTIDSALALRQQQRESTGGLWLNKVSPLETGFDANAQAHQHQLDSLMKQNEESRTFNQGLMAEIRSAFGDLRSPRDTTDARLRATRELIQQRLDEAVRASGARSVQTGYGVDAKGNSVPVGQYLGQAVAPRRWEPPPGFNAVGKKK